MGVLDTVAQGDAEGDYHLPLGGVGAAEPGGVAQGIVAACTQGVRGRGERMPAPLRLERQPLLVGVHVLRWRRGPVGRMAEVTARHTGVKAPTDGWPGAALVEMAASHAGEGPAPPLAAVAEGEPPPAIDDSDSHQAGTGSSCGAGVSLGVS